MESSRPTFKLFSRLPVEIRLQIWKYALPRQSKDKPVICFLKEAGFDVKIHSVSIPSLSGSTTYRAVGFEYSEPDFVLVDVPLLLANYEACCVALDWAQRQGLRISFHGAARCPRVFRYAKVSFDPIYISSAQCVLFDGNLAALANVWKHAYRDGGGNVGASLFERVALSVEEIHNLDWDLYDRFPRISVIFVIIGFQPTREHCWGIKNLSCKLIWHPAAARFRWNGDTTDLANAGWKSHIERAICHKVYPFRQDEVEVRPVTVFRKCGR